MAFGSISLAHFIKGLAICTFRLRRILLVGAYLDLAKSAIFPIIAMVFAGINGTLNAVVSITFVHNNPPV